MGIRNDLIGIAKDLFCLLREFDKEKVTMVTAGVPLKGIGLTVINRLGKMTSYNTIKAN